MTDLTPIISLGNAEGARWYTRQGEQVAEVRNKKGETVKADLGHARVLNLAPGKSAVMRGIYKYQLEQYKIGHGIAAGLSAPRYDGEDAELFITRMRLLADEIRKEPTTACPELREAAAKHAADSRDQGKGIHACLQAHFEGKPVEGEFAPHANGAIAYLNQTLGEKKWRTEFGVAHSKGFGTLVDLLAEDETWLLDVKSKPGNLRTKDGKRLKLWDENMMELSAGREAHRERVGDPERPMRCGILYISRDRVGVCDLIEATEKQLTRGWRKFQAALWLWQEDNEYRPDWAAPLELTP